MTEQTPTMVLEHEHRVIAQVVGSLAAFAEAVEGPGLPKPDALHQVVEFMRSYADRLHHGKEETHLFEVLAQRGVPVTGCPIGALRHEHEAGRRLVRELEAALGPYERGDPTAGERLAALLRSMAELYRGHIWKEDYLLFPMTNKVLGPDDQAALVAAFQQVDAGLGADAVRRLEQVAGDLSGLAGALAKDQT